MDKYYYLLSQLPFLRFGGEAGLSREEFFYQSEKWLEQKDLNNLKQADISYANRSVPNLRVLKEYARFEEKIREEIGKYRAARKKQQEYQPFKTKDILSEENPLKREIKLMSKQWIFIEEMEKDHVFDLSALALYFLKLQILWRMSSFDRETGIKEFARLTGPEIKREEIKH